MNKERLLFLLEKNIYWYECDEGGFQYIDIEFKEILKEFLEELK